MCETECVGGTFSSLAPGLSVRADDLPSAKSLKDNCFLTSGTCITWLLWSNRAVALCPHTCLLSLCSTSAVHLLCAVCPSLALRGAGPPVFAGTLPRTEKVPLRPDSVSPSAHWLWWVRARLDLESSAVLGLQDREAEFGLACHTLHGPGCRGALSAGKTSHSSAGLAPGGASWPCTALLPPSPALGGLDSLAATGESCL